MKIVADEKISGLAALLTPYAQLVLKPGQDICTTDLIHAQALLVRTVTPINASLLQKTSVEFVGSATAGFDHINTQFLNQEKITWAHAPGCNAVAVAEYIVCALAALEKNLPRLPCWQKKTPCAGIIGMGHVGEQVLTVLKQLGYTVIGHDPPRAALDSNFNHTALSEFYDLDLICVHAALTRTGPHPSYHLLNQDFLTQLNPQCLLINAARGEVIDSAALVKSSLQHFCLDVWEHEPNIALALLKRATLATPHIAGYSEQAKLNATKIALTALASYFNLELLQKDLPHYCSDRPHQPLDLNVENKSTVLDIYDPWQHTQLMKSRLEHSQDIGASFTNLRHEYHLRDAFLTTKKNGQSQD